MNTKTSPLSVYALRISLKDAKPPIWRDILVPSNLNLEKLHYVIQTVMGWENSHLHQFIADKVFYANEEDEDEDDYVRDEKKYTLSQILTKEKTSIIYEYDFGDSWIHKIELKKILPADADVEQPRCIKGVRACPPEDSGGVWGYMDMLETLQNSKHPEKEGIQEWLGDDFAPDYFDVDAVNKLLKQLFVTR